MREELHLDIVPAMCIHCNDPVCSHFCPVGAIRKREDGIVVIDEDKCNGCKLCIYGCPYGAIYFNKEKKVAEKAKSLGGKGVFDRKTGEFLASEIEELTEDVGIEPSLGQKISDEELDSCAREVISDERKMANCCRRPSAEEVKSVFTRVIR